MRTTVNIADDVLEEAKSMARLDNTSVGEALSEMARRGMAPRAYIREDPVTGLMVLHTPGVKITSEDVRRAEEEEDRELLQKAGLLGR